MNKIRLLTMLHLMTILAFGQDTWSIVEESNNSKYLYLNVNVHNDIIYTHSLSLSFSDIIPYYVVVSHLEYNIIGSLINQTTRGDIDETFVVITNYRSIINSTESFLIGEFRYPLEPELGSPRGYKILDNEYNVILENHLPLQEDEYGFTTYFNKLNEDSLILLCGYSTSTSHNNLRLFILDNTGEVLNSHDFYSTDFGMYYTLGTPTLLVIEENIYVIVSPYLENNIQDPSNLVIYKLDMEFNLLNTYQTTTNEYYYNNSSAVFPNGDFVVGGVYSDGWDDQGVWMQKYIRKFDKNLNVLWTKLIGSRSQNTGISKLIITNDGGIAGSGIDGFVTITPEGDSIGHISGCLFKLTSEGEEVFFQKYYGLHHPLYGDENVLLDLAEMSDGGFVACGVGKIYFPEYIQRGWIIRVGPDGYLEGNDVGLQQNNSSSVIYLYPNPTSTEFYVNEPEKIKSYQIYDTQGNLLVESNDFPVDIKNYSPGLYLVKIQTKTNEIINQKILKK